MEGMDFGDTSTKEGLRHARNQLYKQWHKERQRVGDLRRRIKELEAQLEDLRKNPPRSGGIH
jgi:cell division protein FtsB